MASAEETSLAAESFGPEAEHGVTPTEARAQGKVQRKPKDRDFVETREGMFFCLIGYLHPPDRYTAYLKYSPDPHGKWRRGQTAYRREMAYYHVSQVAETIRYLEAHYPQYVSDCPVRDIRFSMVPHEYVARYFRPQERLQEILAQPGDSLEEEVCALVAHLTSVTGLSSEHLGVTGSLLTGSHNPAFSDIDLVVYGRVHAARLKERFGPEGTAAFRRPAREELVRWSERVARQHSLSVEEAARLALRRWNYGYFGARYVSIHAIRRDDEIREQYGDRIYRRLGAARLTATLSDVSESCFLPAIYRVVGVTVLEGDPAAAGVGEIVSYEGLYCDVADAGATVQAYGRLETVNGVPSRLVIGAMQPAGGFIKPLGVKGN
jgi:predicted nucleotidyltransferase